MIFIYCKATEDIDVFNDTLQLINNNSEEMSVTIENKRCFRYLKEVLNRITSQDILLIGTVASLGLNDNEVTEALEFIVDKSIRLVINNMASTYEYGTEQPINRAVISTILHSLQLHNKKVVTVNKRANSGRSKMSFPEEWDELYEAWEKKEITSKQFLDRSGLKKATFYNMITEYRTLREKSQTFINRYNKIS